MKSQQKTIRLEECILLDENQVVKCVCDYLKDNNYEIEQSLFTDEKGYDIIANKDGKKLIIEAKGATSSKPGSKRFENGFNWNQVRSHVAVALYAAGQVINSNPEYEVGIALPYNKQHIRAVNEIQRLIVLLKIKIYWVCSDGKVTVDIN